MQYIATEKIPRILWLCWFQGFDRAPEVVKECHASWQRHNPGWDIRSLDDSVIGNYVDLRAIAGKNMTGISSQALSDILRINLLAQHGGVWADATCFCCRPLDHWIDDHARAGFFAFYGPGRDRLFDSWFLAAGRGCHLVTEQCRSVNSFFMENVFNYDNMKRYELALEAVVEKHRVLTGLSFSFPVRRILKIYPYFWSHYLFTQTIRRDRECRRIWEQTKKVSAQEPLKLQRAGLLSPMTETLEKIARHQFLHKLTWKFDEKLYRPGCVLDWILNSGLSRDGG